MQYRKFGKTGVEISALGFGTMRLPMGDFNGKKCIDEDKAILMLRKAYDLGINYFDTAYFYCSGQSEIILGKAIKEIRDRVYISTKFPYWKKDDKTEFRRILEEQLKKLDVNYIDFYHFHELNGKGFESVVKYGHLDEALRAKEEGLIRHMSFSFHDKPEAIKLLVDTGYFETLLCQYNFLDRRNEESMAYARKKGIGIAVMGPVAGGRIAGMPTELAAKLGISVKSNAELALRFVLANPNVDCALSGMSSMEMVEENIEVASLQDETLTADELEALNRLMDEYKRLSELYCTGCNYCKPCPQGVDIPHIFYLMNYYRIYKLKEYAKEEYLRIGINNQGESQKADKCIGCGTCEEKCPQKIRIREQLKECDAVLKS